MRPLQIDIRIRLLPLERVNVHTRLGHEQFRPLHRVQERLIEPLRVRVHRRNALPHLSALLESELADVEQGDAALQALISIAEAAGEPGSPLLRKWLEDKATLVAEEDRDIFITEAAASINEAGGLPVDPAFAEAARRMIAYRESLS